MDVEGQVYPGLCEHRIMAQRTGTMAGWTLVMCVSIPCALEITPRRLCPADFVRVTDGMLGCISSARIWTGQGAVMAYYVYTWLCNVWTERNLFIVIWNCGTICYPVAFRKLINKQTQGSQNDVPSMLWELYRCLSPNFLLDCDLTWLCLTF